MATAPRAAATSTARLPPDADTQQQLLALAATRGRAAQLYARFTPLIVDLLARTGSSSSKSTTVASRDKNDSSNATDELLLQAAFGARLEARVKAGLCAPSAPLTATKAGRASAVSSLAARTETQRQSAAFAAKLAQSLVKAYAVVAVTQGATDADTKSNLDVLVAMDVAAAALFVVLKYERALPLRDLVVDNLLYQVAKKYAELPQGRSAAAFALACLHVRLWRAHSASQPLSSPESPRQQHRDCLALTLTPASKVSTAMLRDVAALPPPHANASASLARLLIGVANVCVTLLVHVKQHEMVVAVAHDTLRPWIGHLAAAPSADDAKLATSLSDRVFRVLWKAASAFDAGDAATDAALRVRALALAFMLDCPTYTALSVVQQTHRVGVQYERTSKRTPADYDAVCTFYWRVIDLLHQRSAALSALNASGRLEWDYVLWLEHAAAVCESAGRTRDAVLVLDCAVRYVQARRVSNDALMMLLRHALVSQLLDLASSSNSSDAALDTADQCVRDKLLQRADPVMRTTIAQHADPPGSPSASSSSSASCDRAAMQCLRNVVAADTQSFAAAACAHKSFVPFALRCAKKTVTKLYNNVVTSTTPTSAELRDLMLASCDSVACGIEAIRTLDAPAASDAATNSDAVVLTESRIRRMIVTLAVHRERDVECDTDANRDARLALLAKQVARVRRLLDDAMDATDSTANGGSDRVLHALLADINAIARECYSCAARAYKREQSAMTLAALTAAFELAESYIEYVMCSATLAATPDAVQHAHAELKVDAIAALLAFCLRERGDLRQARTSAGHALLYASDAHVRVPVQAVDTFVAAVLDELQAGGASAHALSDDVRALVESVAHAFTARGVPELRVRQLVQCIRRAFDLAACRLVESARAGATSARTNKTDDNDASVTAVKTSTCETLQLCAMSDQSMIELLLERGTCSQHQQQRVERAALLHVSRALAERKLGFAAYYESFDAHAAIRALAQTHSLLSDAITALTARDAEHYALELGGACGWRGVVAMEIVLLNSYATPTSQKAVVTIDNSTDECKRVAVDVSEEHALRDIEACVRHFERASASTDDMDSSNALFDAHSVSQCLAAVCSALSLISCPFLETSARSLLTTFQSRSGMANDNDSTSSHNAMLFAWPPPTLELLNLYATGAASACTQSAASATEPSLQQVDAEIALGAKQHAANDAASTVHHVRRALTLLRELKTRYSSASSGSDRASAVKALGMRELLLRLLLSDVHFARGHARAAVAEAKAALSICWKLARKFGSSSLLLADAARFALPEELLQGLNGSGGAARPDGARSASLVYFEALEFSSWDVLHAAKLVLCRIGTLCSLSGQPHRAQVYYTEAMELVGGLDLRFFQRSPFYEYARLQLDASRPDQASAALRVLQSHSDRSQQHAVSRCRQDDADDAVATDCHSCVATDAAVIAQQCNELIQRGDLALVQHDARAAIETYAHALKTLETAIGRLQQQQQQSSAASVRLLQTPRAQCLRKLLRLKATHTDVGDATAVHELLAIRVQLHGCTSSALEDVVERVECLHALGVVDLLLLASPSTRALVDCDAAVRVLEDAYALGDHLALPHVRKQVRRSLGVAYVAAIERPSDSTADIDEYLAWASATLLADSSDVEPTDDAAEHDDAGEAVDLDACLEQLASRLSLAPPARATARETLAHVVTIVQTQVQQLPPSWLVVSVALNAASELVVTRIVNDGESPVSFCLRGVPWQSTMDEVAAVICASRVSLAGNSAAATGAWSTKQKKQWWDTRKQLDERLGAAVQRFQSTLGFWRCLLVRTHPVDKSRVQRCWHMLTTERTSASPRRALELRLVTLLSSLLGSQTQLSDSEFAAGLRHIANELGAALSESDVACIHAAMQAEASECQDDGFDASEDADATAASRALGALTADAIGRMRVSELRTRLAAAGRSTDGLKKVLVERLLEARNSALTLQLPSLRSRDSSDDTGSAGANTSSATILVLDQALHEFPWEALDVLDACSSVTRMPSLARTLRTASALAELCSAGPSRCHTTTSPQSPSIRRKSVRYVLNAAGDLASTQRQLAPILERGRDTLGWRGIVGRVPDEAEMRECLTSADLFIYCGHGSGEKYLHRSKIRELTRGCSAALLFGCSSGRLEREGIFGPDGAVLAYLRAGSPAVLAMLWDVTDRDIDQLSVAVLHKWLLRDSNSSDDVATIATESSSEPLARALRDARAVCKLKFLNGHAAVCYGLPLFTA